MNWIVYNELAWTDTGLACPESYEEEAMNYVKVIKDSVSAPLQEDMIFISGSTFR